MCGRYRRKSDKQRIAAAFEVYAGLNELDLAPEGDIAPGSVQPVIFENEGERQIEMMRWGFKLPNRLLFNARSEGIGAARFWSEQFKKRRCIIPADTFFEWAKQAKGAKPKYELTVPGREPFGMAGVWSPWRTPKAERWEDTFAILTGDANAVMQPIHNRQPIILEPREYAEYLASAARAPFHLLRTLPDEELFSNLLAKDNISIREASLFDG